MEMPPEPDIITCDNCKRDIPKANFTVHSLHCSRNLRLCPVCKEPVPISELPQHHEMLHRSLACEQCGEDVKGSDLEDHIRDSCALTMAACRYCDLDLFRRDLPAHETYCGARTHKCECGELVMLKYQQLHEQTNHGFIKLDDEPGPEPSWRRGNRPDFIPQAEGSRPFAVAGGSRDEQQATSSAGEVASATPESTLLSLLQGGSLNGRSNDGKKTDKDAANSKIRQRGMKKRPAPPPPTRIVEEFARWPIRETDWPQDVLQFPEVNGLVRRPMSPDQFERRFNRLQVERAGPSGAAAAGVGEEEEEEGDSDDDMAAAPGGGAGGDRFGHIKRELTQLRRGLNEVTAPYNAPPNRQPKPSPTHQTEIRHPIQNSAHCHSGSCIQLSSRHHRRCNSRRTQGNQTFVNDGGNSAPANQGFVGSGEVEILDNAVYQVRARNRQNLVNQMAMASGGHAAVNEPCRGILDNALRDRPNPILANALIGPRGNIPPVNADAMEARAVQAAKVLKNPNLRREILDNARYAGPEPRRNPQIEGALGARNPILGNALMMGHRGNVMPDNIAAVEARAVNEAGNRAVREGRREILDNAWALARTNQRNEGALRARNPIVGNERGVRAGAEEVLDNAEALRRNGGFRDDLDDDDDSLLPCEYCGLMMTGEELLQHESRCRVINGHVAASPPPRNDNDGPLIPCEFCSHPCPIFLLMQHQQRCRDH